MKEQLGSPENESAMSAEYAQLTGRASEQLAAAEDKADQIEPELEQDEEFIEGEVDRYLAEKPEFTAAFGALQKARSNGNATAESAATQMIRKLRNDAKSSLGYAPEGSIADEQRQGKVAEALSELTGDEDDITTLKHLGMVDADGRFQYPTNLFSDATNQLWNKYVLAAKEHVALSEQVAELGVNHAELDALNIVRRRRHNELARSIMRDLSMEESEDNFYQARQLAAKMRDVRFPNTGEMSIAAGFAKQLLSKIRREGEAA